MTPFRIAHKYLTAAESEWVTPQLVCLTLQMRVRGKLNDGALRLKLRIRYLVSL